VVTTSEEAKSSIAGVFDRSAGTYDRVDVDFFQPMGRTLVERAAVQPGEDVLDVGCGRGAALFAALDVVGPTGSVTGVDLAPRMVELTGAEVRGSSNASVLVGDAERPDFPPGSFDVVLANQVLFFLPDPGLALRSYATLLRSGGRLAFSTFAAEDAVFGKAMGAFAKFAPGAAAQRERFQQSPFRAEEPIRSLLAAEGYSDVVITSAEYPSRFRDAEHWLEWAWSHGGRALLERVSADDFPQARAAAFEQIEAARSASGDLVLTTGVRFTVAVPGTPANPRTP
jgi:ubiquinone/menaquinone biosynthesis C-methylase UbiE